MTYQPIMTVEQVACYLQVNPMTIYRYVNEGYISASKIGRYYRIRKDDVDRFLELKKVSAWDRLCMWGREFAKQKGITPKELEKAIEEYRTEVDKK